jgi:aminoglycoside phosphotransferase (APT) family kinase protein
VPRAVTFDPEPGIVLMEDLPGRELKRALPEEDAERLIFEAGQLMAAFHQIPKRVRPRVTHRSELRQVASAARTVAEAFPALRPRLRAVMAKLRAWQPVAGPCALLHGACRLKHLFVHDGRLALVDLDGMAVGPPSFDLCHFLSSLYYLEEQERFDTAERRTYARRFLEGYAQDTRFTIGPRMLLWYFAALVIHKQASKYVTHLHDDSVEKADCMLALAETALARYPDAPADGSLAGAWELLP